MTDDDRPIGSRQQIRALDVAITAAMAVLLVAAWLLWKWAGG